MAKKPAQARRTIVMSGFYTADVHAARGWSGCPVGRQGVLRELFHSLSAIFSVHRATSKSSLNALADGRRPGALRCPATYRAPCEAAGSRGWEKGTLCDRIGVIHGRQLGRLNVLRRPHSRVHVPQQFLIAVCDILGFSDLVEKNPLDEVVNSAFGWFRRALHHSIHKNEFPSDIPKKSETEAHEHVGVAWFSDTVLLYALRDDDEAVRQLLMTVGWLIFETMLNGMTRIRGGISYGEALIDRENSIFVGKAIVDAYRLEREQEWSGAALTAAACNRIPENARSGEYADWWIVPYRVPLKGGSFKNTLAVNWTWGVHHPGWRLAWSESAEEPTETDWRDKPDICRKFVNTKAFHDAFCRDCIPRNRLD